MGTLHRTGPAVIGAALLLAVHAAAAQHGGTLVGTVSDSGGRPIAHAEVRLRGSAFLVRSDDSGGFRFPTLPAGPARVDVRRLGFAPLSVAVSIRAGQTDSLLVALDPVAALLPGMLVEDDYTARSHRLLAGFWERRSRGFGHFFTRAEIAAREAHDFTDIVRTTPGVTITSVNGRKAIRLARGGSARGDCPPQYFVDGLQIENASPDEFTPTDVEAVELYAGLGTIPPQFAPRMYVRTCGAIIIWTRLPGG